MRVANAVLKRRPISFEVATPQGFRFAGTTRDVIQRHVYLFGVWEPDITAWVRSHVSYGDIVVDVGANVGYFTLLAAERVGAEGFVHAVEPLPSTVEKLRRNVALNHPTRVSIHEVACGERSGEVEMFAASEENIGSASTLGGERSEGSVQCLTLDQILHDADLSRLALVKVDTEGGENAVLRGATGTLAAMRAGSAVLVEISNDASQVLELMSTHGFDAFTIDNDYRPARYADRRVAAPRALVDVPTRPQDVIFVKRHISSGSAPL